MRKVYMLEIILAVWLIILILMLFPAVVKAEDSGAPMVAFTFDDGPNASPSKTVKLLDGLAERGAKATFFVLGERLDYKSDKPNIEENRALVARMAEEGHVVGNHTYSHVWLNQISPKRAAYELSRTSELIREVTGSEPKYMRPPGGSTYTSARVRELAYPMITVCWSCYDVRDWECRNVDKMVNTIVNNTFDGDIILMHDCYETSVETVLEAIDILSERGYRFVTIDELLSRNTDDDWELDPSRIYCTMRPGDVSKLRRTQALGKELPAE